MGKLCIRYVYYYTRYFKCTEISHHRPWCAITDNYDRDKQWGNCALGMFTIIHATSSVQKLAIIDLGVLSLTIMREMKSGV